MTDHYEAASYLIPYINSLYGKGCMLVYSYCYLLDVSYLSHIPRNHVYVN
jgi:hypothetical protein